MLLLYIVSFKEFGSLVCLWHYVKLRKTQLEVRSLTATWSRDLWGHRVVVFLEMCQIVGWTAMANLAALRAAVLSLSAKNLTGGWNQPPAGARVKIKTAHEKRRHASNDSPISFVSSHLCDPTSTFVSCEDWRAGQRALLLDIGHGANSSGSAIIRPLCAR